jgi:hypothetical protein
MRENRGEQALQLLICDDVISLLGKEINTTKRNTEALLGVGSDYVLQLRAGKTKCVTFSCCWNVINKEGDTSF